MNQCYKTTTYFNSQPHKEADGSMGKWKSTNRSISTHSLTRRLTDIEKGVLVRNVFQLTASQGG